MLLDSKNNIWACTNGAGLLKLTYSATTPGEIDIKQYLRTADSTGAIGSNYVSCITEDQNNYFLGRHFRGAQQVRCQQRNFY
ncbi:MAG: hypothetical protein HC896_10240 [Bacteroidales bacterium]|nr:hypothetical protein [Bacteroidales bacterium]